MFSFHNLYFMNFIVSVAENDGVFTLAKSALQRKYCTKLLINHITTRPGVCKLLIQLHAK